MALGRVLVPANCGWVGEAAIYRFCVGRYRCAMRA
jgi:hypothetical protein